MKRIVTKVLASVAVVGALSLLGGVSTGGHMLAGGNWPTPICDGDGS